MLGHVRYDRLWEQLIESLDEWTSARQAGPARIEVALPDSGSGSRSVQIVMTPDEWEDMTGTVFGGFDYAVDYVKETLAAMTKQDAFAVFSTYDLVPSPTPELPVDPTTERLDALARDHPEGIGGWFTYGSDPATRHTFRPDQD